jgi:opine dehydrogenase
MKIAVLGGGHGCYAAAADLARPATRSASGAATRRRSSPVVAAGAIVLVDERGRREVPLALASADIGAAIAGAELIVLPTPASAQDDIARAMAPHLEDGQVVFLAPGNVRQLRHGARRSRARIARRRRLGRDRHPARTWRGSSTCARCA